MKIYIVCEHCDSWGGTPNDMIDVILGVALTKEAAEECLWSHVRYGYSRGMPELILEGANARDTAGTIYFVIIEHEADQCSTPTY